MKMLQNQIYHNMNIWNKVKIEKSVVKTTGFLTIESIYPSIDKYPYRVYYIFGDENGKKDDKKR